VASAEQGIRAVLVALGRRRLDIRETTSLR